METIGKKLLKTRRTKKISQKNLSELSGVSRSYLSEIENDRYTNISIVILCNLCKALNTTPNELIPEHLYKREVE